MHKCTRVLDFLAGELFAAVNFFGRSANSMLSVAAKRVAQFHKYVHLQAYKFIGLAALRTAEAGKGALLSVTASHQDPEEQSPTKLVADWISINKAT